MLDAGGRPAALPAAMTVAEAVRLRRSVRAYAPTPVDAVSIRRLLDAAVLAPTAMHEEPWAFVVVQDRRLLKRLSDRAKEFLDAAPHDLRTTEGEAHRFRAPDNVFYDAGTLIVVYGRPLGPFVAADCWLAAGNILLTARAMGLGTCVIGLAVPALNAPEWKEELGVPRECTAYAPIIVGVPAGETAPPGRRDPRILSWRVEDP